MDCNEEELSLVEEKEEEMVLFGTSSKQPIKRRGWFLKPISSSLNQSLRSPIFPSHHKSALLDAGNVPKVLFSGWGNCPARWNQWVAKLRPIYMDLWKKVGIFNAIIASTYKFRRDSSSLLGVISFWCGETNTFLFPWGEATLTLEDVMVLGGFPVLGEPVRVNGPLEGEMGEIESKMIREHKDFNTRDACKADNYIWIRHYMEQCQSDELEHIAFLCLWLSRFVFPGRPLRTVRRCMIPMAVRLARGIRIALGPAVLASLYRDLRAIRNYLAEEISLRISPLLVWAPFSMLQQWVWERFSALRPKYECSVDPSEPRVARWHNVLANPDVSSTMLILESLDEFEWRPYSAGLYPCCKPSICRDNGGWVCGNVADDDELASYTRWLRASNLVGLDCIEEYLPHRVARQFGFDQDIPGFVPHSISTWQAAWETYDVKSRAKFCILPKHLKSDITLQYSVWWENVQGVIGEEKERKKRKKARSLVSRKKRRVQDLYMMTQDSFGPRNKGPPSNVGYVRPHKPATNSTVMQTRHTGMKTTNTCINLQVPLEPSETTDSDFLSDIQAMKGTSLGEKFISDPMEIRDGGVMRDVRKINARGSADEPIVKEELEEKLQVEAIVEARITKEKEAEVELKIKKLKEEIASIQAKMLDLEAQSKPQRTLKAE